MVRSLTFVLATVGAVAVLSAQTPAPGRPAGDQPTAQQPPYTPAPAPTPSPAAEPAKPATQSQMSSMDKETWRGCLKPGPTAGTWVLENAQIAPAAGAKAGEPSSVGTAGTAASKKTLTLVTKPADNLTPHANHQIDVVGSLSPASASATATAGASSSSSATAAKQSFNVDSFKMVSSSCQ